MTKVLTTNRENRLCQGDIFKDVDFIDKFEVHETGDCDIEVITFPLVMILSQDCDLRSDYLLRDTLTKAAEPEKTNIRQGQLLFSVIVVPLYNAEHMYTGSHLEDIGIKKAYVMPKPNPKKGNTMTNNKNPRFHYLNIEESDLVPYIIDFKHYFTVQTNYLYTIRDAKFVCSLGDLYREDISQRFASYLSRIGLPNSEVNDSAL